MLEFGLSAETSGNRLSLNQVEEVLFLLRRRDAVGTHRSRSILHYEVGREFVLASLAHRRHVVSRGRACRIRRTARPIVVHDVGKVDPLVTAPFPICRRIWLGTWHLRNAYSLLLLRIVPHQHRRLSMSRRRRLRADR